MEKTSIFSRAEKLRLKLDALKPGEPGLSFPYEPWQRQTVYQFALYSGCKFKTVKIGGNLRVWKNKEAK